MQLVLSHADALVRGLEEGYAPWRERRAEALKGDLDRDLARKMDLARGDVEVLMAESDRELREVRTEAARSCEAQERGAHLPHLNTNLLCPGHIFCVQETFVSRTKIVSRTQKRCPRHNELCSGHKNVSQTRFIVSGIHFLCQKSFCVLDTKNASRAQ